MMKSKHEIPNKFDYMKVHSGNFLVNERVFGELTHKDNVGKIDQEFYTLRDESKDLLKEKVMEESDYSRLYKENKKGSNEGIITESKIDFTGTAPKRYTTKCYIEPKTVPIWYTETILLHIGSTRRRYEEKVYFKNKLLPFKWTEDMVTTIKSEENMILSETHIPVEKSDVHYISFEPQQMAAAAN